MDTTPVTEPGLRTFDDRDPVVAILMAWMVTGPQPEWHYRMQDQVRRAMPVLARALDRAAVEVYQA